MDSTAPDDAAFLDEVFARFLQDVEEGRACDPETVAKARPDLRDEIAELARMARTIDPWSSARTAELPDVPGYEILARLGQGTSGTVYRARPTSGNGEDVALKVLHPAARWSASAIRRFKQEARALSRLAHPSIVSSSGLVEANGVHALVMEYIDGASLRSVLERLPTDRSTLNEQDAAHAFGMDQPEPFVRLVGRLGLQLSEALVAVHSVGLLHRDVKPSNILIRRDGRALLSDFGLVHDPEASVRTRSAGFLGTQAYASPEVLRGSRADVAGDADVFSLGITLYELLCGARPFEGANQVQLLQGMERREASPASSLNPDVPRDLQTIIHRAIAVDRDLRYGSAEDMAEDLRRLLDLRPVASRPPGWVYQTRRTLKRHAGRIALLLIALFLSLAGAQVLQLRKESVTRAREETARDARQLIRDAYCSISPLVQVAGLIGDGGLSPALSDGLAMALEKLEGDPDLAPEVQDDLTFLRLAEELVGDRPDTLALDAGFRARNPTTSAYLEERVADPGQAAPDDLRRLAFAAALDGDFAMLSRLRTTYLEEGGSSPLMATLLGEVELMYGHHGAAFALLREAHAQLPDQDALLIEYADACLRAGEVTLAGNLVEEARTRKAEDPFQVLDRIEADVAIANGDLDRALAGYRSLIRTRLSPSISWGHAWLLWERGERHAAIAAFASYTNKFRTCEGVRRTVTRLTETWWTGLSPEEKGQVVRSSIEEPTAPKSLFRIGPSLHEGLASSVDAPVRPWALPENLAESCSLHGRVSSSGGEGRSIDLPPRIGGFPEERTNHMQNLAPIVRELLVPVLLQVKNAASRRRIVRMASLAGMALAFAGHATSQNLEPTGRVKTYEAVSGELPELHGFTLVDTGQTAPPALVGDTLAFSSTGPQYQFYAAELPPFDNAKGATVRVEARVTSAAQFSIGITSQQGQSHVQVWLSNAGVSLRLDTQGSTSFAAFDTSQMSVYEIQLSKGFVLIWANGQALLGSPLPDYGNVWQNSYVYFGDATINSSAQVEIKSFAFSPFEHISGQASLNDVAIVPYAAGGTYTIHLDAGAAWAHQPFWLVTMRRTDGPRSSGSLLTEVERPASVVQGVLDAQGRAIHDFVVAPGGGGLLQDVYQHAYFTQGQSSLPSLQSGRLNTVLQ